MWKFTEQDIENYFIDKSLVAIGRRKFRIIENQLHITLLEGVERNPQTNQFTLFQGMTDALPIINGKRKIPDLIAYKVPKHQVGEDNELWIFELKEGDASLADAGQLNQYLTVMKFFIRNNIDGINRKLNIKRTYKLKGGLLARTIPVEVWLATPNQFSQNPEIELFAYEIKSYTTRKEIKGIVYKNFTRFYRKAFGDNKSKYIKLIEFGS